MRGKRTGLSFVAASLIFAMRAGALSDFEVTKIDQAHAAKITGAGTFVGVVDSPINLNHPYLTGIVLGQAIGVGYTPDYSVDVHGSHVAGIIAGKAATGYSGGAAPGARIYGLQIAGANTTGSNSSVTAQNAYEYFKDKSVKIINNSWNGNYYPIIGMKAPGEYSATILSQNASTLKGLAIQDATAKSLSTLALAKNTLMVFASGNEGMSSPGVNATLPYYDEAFRSYLVVGALDSAHITQGADGKLTLDTKAVIAQSNGFKGTSNFSLMAPGMAVNNVNGAYGAKPVFGRADTKLLVKKSGTSMAAPMVSAAAALVAEKFPFLNGKQLADVLLSTADNSFTAPKMIVKETKLKRAGQAEANYYTLIYIDTPVPTDTSKIQADFARAGYNTAYLGRCIDNWYLGDKQAYPCYQSMSRAEVFGAGILDAQKALGGLALLDANRLTNNDIQLIKNNTTQAYYTLDLGSHSATFSNDIAQRKWDDATHLTGALNSPAAKIKDLDIGLIKRGKGTLTLTGANSYAGYTIVAEGELQLHKNGLLGGLLASKTYIESGATLSGDGTIKNELENSGTLRPGKADLSNLTLTGAYTQNATGKLVLDFGYANGAGSGAISNSQLIAPSYDIRGGDLIYNPLQNGYYAGGQHILIALDQKLGASLDKFSQVRVEAASQSLDFKLDVDKVNINKPAPPPAPVVQPTQPVVTQPVTQPVAQTPVAPVAQPVAQPTQPVTQPVAQTPVAAPVTTPVAAPVVQPTQPVVTQPVAQTPVAAPVTTPVAAPVAQPTQPTQPTQPVVAPVVSPVTTPVAAPVVQQPVAQPVVQPTQPVAQTPAAPVAQPVVLQPIIIVVTPYVKPDAYNGKNAVLGGVLRQVRDEELGQLGEKYKNYFAFLDSAPQATYEAALRSIDARMTPVNTSSYYSEVVHVIDPYYSSQLGQGFLAFKDQPIRLAANGNDYDILRSLNFDDNKYFWRVDPGYKRINNPDGHGSMSSIDLAFGMASSGNFGYARVKGSQSELSFDYGKLAKKNLDIGFEFNQEAEFIRFIFGSNINYGLNQSTRKVLAAELAAAGQQAAAAQGAAGPSAADLMDATYSNYILSAHAGITKNIYITTDLVFNPVAYVNYDLIYQPEFTETGGLFAKSFYPILSGSSSFVYGGYLTYHVLDASFSTFAMQQLRIDGTQFIQRSSFVDFPSSRFTTIYELSNRASFFGVSAQFKLIKDVFIGGGLQAELTQHGDNFSGYISVGKSF